MFFIIVHHPVMTLLWTGDKYRCTEARGSHQKETDQ